MIPASSRRIYRAAVQETSAASQGKPLKEWRGFFFFYQGITNSSVPIVLFTDVKPGVGFMRALHQDYRENPAPIMEAARKIKRKKL